MTVLAIALLAVWAVGIAGAVASFPHFLRENPMAAIPFDLNPVGACLITAVAIAFWPGALAAAALNRLVRKEN